MADIDSEFADVLALPNHDLLLFGRDGADAASLSLMVRPGYSYLFHGPEDVWARFVRVLLDRGVTLAAEPDAVFATVKERDWPIWRSIEKNRSAPRR